MGSYTRPHTTQASATLYQSADLVDDSKATRNEAGSSKSCSKLYGSYCVEPDGNFPGVPTLCTASERVGSVIKSQHKKSHEFPRSLSEKQEETRDKNSFN